MGCPAALGDKPVTAESRRVIAFAPGRVNLIGEHTDYNDGLALPFAIERGITVTAERSGGEEVEVLSALRGERDRFAPIAPPAVTGWRAFARGVVGELAAVGVTTPPCRLEIASELRAGSGLSSSAALSVALALALLALAGEREPDRIGLARLCSRVENHWVGAQTGLLDQLASLYGQAGAALRIDFRALALEPVLLALEGWTLALLDSGASRALAASGYNARRRECREACAALGLSSLRDATAADLERLSGPHERRARHVVEENDRVERMVGALRSGDLPAAGRLLDASHASLLELYECSSPTVEQTVSALRSAGAAGARMMGGGFGGSVLALFPPDVPPPPGALAVAPGAAARVAPAPGG